MSHFTRIKTKMMEKEYLLQALTDLKYSYSEGRVKIRGYGGRRTEVDIKVPTKFSGYDIGLRQTANGYEIIADWWGIKSPGKKKFVQQITQRYAYCATRAKLEAQGFILVDEARQKGEIHLVLRRMT